MLHDAGPTSPGARLSRGLGSNDPAATSHVIRFLKAPTSRIYLITYPAEPELCPSFVAAESERFHRLLTEQVRVPTCSRRGTRARRHRALSPSTAGGRLGRPEARRGSPRVLSKKGAHRGDAGFPRAALAEPVPRPAPYSSLQPHERYSSIHSTREGVVRRRIVLGGLIAGVATVGIVFAASSALGGSSASKLLPSSSCGPLFYKG